MKIVGTVAPDEVPAGDVNGGRDGVWSGLARRTMKDHDEGRVTMIELADDDELKRMRNGTSNFFRERGLRLRPVLVRQPDSTMRVFMQLEPKPSVA
jgi:hypothetical protein